MKPEHAIVERWFRDWRLLRAWNRALSECTATIAEWNGQGNLGLAYDTTRRAVLRVRSDDLPDSLATVLHELAHLADGRPIGCARDAHGARWRALFQAAVEEVTGEYVYVGMSGEEGWTRQDVDDALSAAVKRWWQRSGNALLAMMLVKGPTGRW